MRKVVLDDFLTSIGNARDAATTWHAGQSFLADLGFDLCVYQFGDWDRDPHAPYRALTNKPLGWTDAHFANLSPDTEPLLAFGCKHFTVQTMGISFADNVRQLPTHLQPFMDRLASDGWRSIIAFPLRLRNGGPFGGWAMSQQHAAARPFLKLVQEHEPLARLACFHVHEKLNEYAGQTREQCLSGRQQDALLWSARGMRQAQIAERLGISVATVEFHLRCAREKLGAHTNQEAISRAIIRRLINP